MRSDMFEVIIERPRGNPSYGRTNGRRGERRRQEEGPLREPVSRRHGTKHLNENLAPLHRFLVSRVGRPWNAVHSEMCAHLSVRSAVQKHVLDHVKDMVEVNAVLVDGVPHRWGFGGPLQRISAGWRWGGLYVCPRSGLLRIVTERRPPHPV